MDEKRYIKILWFAKAFLVVVLAYAGVKAIATRLHPGKAFDPSAVRGDERPHDGQAALPEDQGRSDYSEIVRRNLFTGTDGIAYPQVNANRSAFDSMASAEELGLKLMGAIAGGPAASRAIIQNTSDKTIGTYRIGDIIASATVDAIQRDAVILRHQGRHLVLRLHTGAGSDDRTAPAKEERATAQAAKGTASPPPLSTQAGYVEEIFHSVTIEPYKKNNRTQGLRITGLEKVPLAELFGLKNGDVIRTINGQQLTSKQKAFQVLMKAKTQSKVDIQLLRDGKSKDLSFEI